MIQIVWKMKKKKEKKGANLLIDVRDFKELR